MEGQNIWISLLKRAAVILAMVIAFFPIYWLIATSLKPFEEWASWPPVWLTDNPTLQNYRIVFFPEAAREFASEQSGSLDYKVSGSAWKAFQDSAIISTFATLLSVTFGTLAAYSVARFRTGGENYPFQFLTVRMVPPIAVVVPMVALFSMLRLSDTYIGMILAYTAFTLPFSLWMIRSFIEDFGMQEVRPASETADGHPLFARRFEDESELFLITATAQAAADRKGRLLIEEEEQETVTGRGDEG